MPPLKHAKLSPSSAERWISCPASIRMAAAVPQEDTGSIYALEGTAAHALAEIKARAALLGDDDPGARAAWEKEFPQFAIDADMEAHADAYVEFLRERLEADPLSVLMLEQRLDTGVPTCWGTSDAVIVSPDHVEIVDFKYGAGVPVSALGNPQARLYACGALDMYDGLLGDIGSITTTIYQPRLNNVSSETIQATELRTWRGWVIPIAESALGPDAPFGPSEEACRWCPAAGRCRAQVEAATSEDFGHDPELLSAEELAEQLGRVKFVKQWLAALEAQGLRMAYADGVDIPGWKVVRSGSRRTIPDEEGAILHLTQSTDFEVEQFAKLKLRTLGDLEKLLGKGAAFTAALGDYVVMSEGNPSLVPESDRRKAISREADAASDFLVPYEEEE